MRDSIGKYTRINALSISIGRSFIRAPKVFPYQKCWSQKQTSKKSLYKHGIALIEHDENQRKMRIRKSQKKTDNGIKMKQKKKKKKHHKYYTRPMNNALHAELIWRL